MILTFLSAQTAEILEIIATVTFVAFLVLQILHSRFMWYLYIPSCICAALNFFNSSTWAFAALNIYYILMGFQGLWHWKKDRNAGGGDNGTVVLNRLPAKIVIISAVLVAVGIPALYFAMKAMNDPNPLLDAITTSLSIIGTWWLAHSYIQQWWIWIVADIFAIWMNVNLGNKWFVMQFIACIISSFIGLYIWSRKGVYARN